MKSRKILGLALAVAVGVGGCSGQHPESTAQRAHSSPYYFSAKDRDTLTQAFYADRGYLVGQGLTKAAGVQLVLLEGDQTFYCSDDESTFTAAGPGPEYCAGKLIVNAAFVNVDLPKLAAAASSDPKVQQEIITAGEQFVIGHELGHEVQDVQGIIKTETPAVYAQSKEPQADCTSGQLMGVIAPNQLQDVVLLLEQFPQHDLAHGNPAVRIAAFEQGANGNACTAQSMVDLSNQLDPH